MEGQSVFKAAVTEMSEVTLALLLRNQLTPEGLAWLVPHQANRRIIEAVAKRLELPLAKVMVNIERYGNTSAATIPLCLSEWRQADRLRRGERLVLTSFGAGFTSGSVYLRWDLNPCR
jgi:3-oxoacyl-[acyl-carrier-protein] synthase-3